MDLEKKQWPLSTTVIKVLARKKVRQLYRTSVPRSLTVQARRYENWGNTSQMSPDQPVPQPPGRAVTLELLQDQ